MERKYSADEVTAILDGAAEKTANTRETSMTLAELETIGQEAGLDRALVRHAALDVDRIEERPRGQRWHGASTRLTARATVDAPVDIDVLADQLFSETADWVGAQGSRRESGSDRVWQTTSYDNPGGQGPKLSLTLRAKGDRTEIVLREDVGSEAAIGIGIRMALATAAGAIGGLILGGVLAQFEEGVFLAVAGAPVHAAWGWLLGKRWWRRKQRRLTKAHAERMQALVTKAETATTPSTSK